MGKAKARKKGAKGAVHPPRAELCEVRVADLVPSPNNPRRIDRKAPGFRELCESVRSQGVRQPVQVRLLPRKRGQSWTVRKWDLLAGARRHAAALEVGLETIPALNYDGISDQEAFEITFIENIAREDLTPAEHGRAVQTLLEKYSGDVKAVASKLGRPERWVRTHARLADLHPDWQKELDKAGSFTASWTMGHIELVISLPQDIQRQMLSNFRQQRWLADQRSTIKKLAAYINENYVHLLCRARWDLEDATLDEKAGACWSCPKRSSRQGLLFVDLVDIAAVKKLDRCLDITCWRRKHTAWVALQVEAKRKQHPKLVCVVSNYETASAETRKTYGETLQDYDFNSSKKSDKNSVPAITVQGPGAGQIRWIRPRGAKAERAAKMTRTGKKAVTPLKVRRKLLESKRGFETKKLLAAKLEQIGLTDLPIANEDIEVELIRLAACFGTSRRRESWWDAGNKDPWRQLAAYRKSDSQGMDKPYRSAEDLWKVVRDVLIGRISYSGPITQVPDGVAKQIKNIAELCGIDLAPLRAEAAKTYPVPKSWKFLNPNGTPKKKPKGKKSAKGKATTKKAKATKKKPSAKKKKAKNKKMKMTRGVCRKCGCTEAHACPGGCSWADDSKTLCTACA